ncbi:MAG TPA: hypothetical protein VGO46_15000 [Gemmatimonadaceae bacterium]|jgi:hypothetical protein|nr:hypothetical protein [Gemmatimonadaceae bacterium]
MLRKISAVMFAVLLVVTAASSASAQHGGGKWSLLGERHIDGRADNDKIDIGKDNGSYRAIQFRVQGGTVNFDRISVKYLNGEHEEIDVRSEIPPGGRTRAIDLPGNRRVIESISMWYSKGNWRTRPTVRVYGMR